MGYGGPTHAARGPFQYPSSSTSWPESLQLPYVVKHLRGEVQQVSRSPTDDSLEQNHTKKKNLHNSTSQERQLVVPRSTFPGRSSRLAASLFLTGMEKVPNIRRGHVSCSQHHRQEQRHFFQPSLTRHQRASGFVKAPLLL